MNDVGNSDALDDPSLMVKMHDACSDKCNENKLIHSVSEHTQVGTVWTGKYEYIDTASIYSTQCSSQPRNRIHSDTPTCSRYNKGWESTSQAEMLNDNAIEIEPMLRKD